ncbi:hypothetical protein H8D91_01305 [archaeon]|nr:hypothetical protein [archaeon]
MNNGKFFSLLFITLVTALFISSIAMYFYVISLDKNILRAEPYVNEIVFNNSDLRELALNYTFECEESDISCKVNNIYRNVVDREDYISDIEGQEVIKSPFETLSQGGGDCEDLAILASSLLENLGIHTYLVLTQNHAYALACGVDMQKTKEYGQESLKEIYAAQIENETHLDVSIIDGQIFVTSTTEELINLNSGEVFFISGGRNTGYMNLVYDLSSQNNFDFFIVLSKSEFDKFLKGSFNFVKDCDLAKGYCNNLPISSGIIIANKNSFPIEIDSKIDFQYHYDSSRFFINQSRSFYQIKNATCVVLETTAGPYGFVGLASDDLVGEKLAFDPHTNEYFSLG